MLSTKNNRQGYFYLDKAYPGWIDQEEIEKKKYIEKAILLHESRKERIPAESDIEDDHVVISIRHLCWELNKDCLEEMQN